MESKNYPHLQALLSGWFHQDFDIAGDSLESVIAEFNRVSPNAETQLVIADIGAFLSNCKRGVDNAFRREFSLEIDPTAFAPSVDAFLMQLATQLAIQ